MSATATADSGPQAGPSSLAQGLRGCFTTGLLLVEEATQRATLNPEAAAILGLNTESCPLAMLPTQVLSVARDVLGSRRAGAQELELAVPGRGRAVLRVLAMPVGPDVRAVALAVTEITAWTHCEEQLQDLERLANAGRLAAATAHEIRNALVAGKTFIDLLLEQNRDAELAEIVRKELARIDGLVKRLLSFPAPERLSIGEVRLHQVLDYSLRLVQPQLAGKDISVQRSFLASPDVAQGDERALQQAFVNLLLNGLEAMAAAGTLTVGTAVCALPQTAPSAPQVVVTISDTGVGIAPENLGHLFEPFFTTKPGGTGLGLAITRRIIQEHHGAITVESTVGRGTTFAVTLPAR